MAPFFDGLKDRTAAGQSRPRTKLQSLAEGRAPATPPRLLWLTM